MNNETVKSLEKAGSILIERARTYSFKTFQSGDIYIMHDFVAIDFRNWKESVIKLAKSLNNEVVVNHINNYDTLFIDSTKWASKAISQKTKQTALKLYIDNVGKILKELKVLEVHPNNADSYNKIKITISDKGIYRIKDEKELVYKIKKSGKRRKMIDYLLKADTPTNGTELIKKFNYNDKELLSKEIGEINKSFTSRLVLGNRNDSLLIINYQTGDGYILNKEKYYFE